MIEENLSKILGNLNINSQRESNATPIQASNDVPNSSATIGPKLGTSLPVETRNNPHDT